MPSDIPVLYSTTERRLRPLTERIEKVILEHPEPVSNAEIVGVLEDLKLRALTGDLYR